MADKSGTEGQRKEMVDREGNREEGEKRRRHQERTGKEFKDQGKTEAKEERRIGRKDRG